MTIDELFQSCWNEHWDCERFNKSGHAQEVRSKYQNHIKSRFGQSDYLKLTRSEVRDFHKGYRSTPVTGNRLLEILSKLYKFSIDKEWNELGFNPCFGIKHFTERKRRRYASETEIKRIGLILDRMHSEYPVEITFLYTLLFTGSRPRALERATWNEFQELDGGFGVLTFEGKSTQETGDLESVILAPEIVEKLRKLTRRDDDLIFGIKSPGYLFRKIRAEAGCKDMWLRDFRRSFATIGMSSGVKMDTIGELLNHHSTNTTKRYALLNNKARLEAVSTISDKINSLLKK
jgi:integrase